MKIRWYHMAVYWLFRATWNGLLRDKPHLSEWLEQCLRNYRTGEEPPPPFMRDTWRAPR